MKSTNTRARRLRGRRAFTGAEAAILLPIVQDQLAQMNQGQGQGTAAPGGAGAPSAMNPNFIAPLISAITGLFGGPSGPPPASADPTDDLSPAVRQWWNSGMGGDWFTQWLRANKPEAFRWTLNEILPLYYVALMATGKTPFWGAPPGDPRVYVQGLTEDAYAAMGVDYAATRSRYLSLPSEQRTAANVYVMLPGGGTPDRPAVGAPSQSAREATPNTGNGPEGVSDGSTTVFAVIVIAVIAYLALK